MGVPSLGHIGRGHENQRNQHKVFAGDFFEEQIPENTAEENAIEVNYVVDEGEHAGKHSGELQVVLWEILYEQDRPVFEQIGKKYQKNKSDDFQNRQNDCFGMCSAFWGIVRLFLTRWFVDFRNDFVFLGEQVRVFLGFWILWIQIA